MRFYTGVGSRETPIEILDVMTRVAEDLGERSWALRSGGCYGADWAFETGADNVCSTKHIYLPWEGFGRPCTRGCRCTRVISNLRKEHPKIWGKVEEAEAIASEIHPKWDDLTRAMRLLHTRNVFQLLGDDLKSPSEVVICWTPRGSIKGGTATVIRIANERRIPVVNLGGKHWTIRKLVRYVGGGIR